MFALRTLRELVEPMEPLGMWMMLHRPPHPPKIAFRAAHGIQRKESPDCTNERRCRDDDNSRNRVEPFVIREVPHYDGAEDEVARAPQLPVLARCLQEPYCWRFHHCPWVQSNDSVERPTTVPLPHRRARNPLRARGGHR